MTAHPAQMAARTLAQFGDAGYAALVAILQGATHPVERMCAIDALSLTRRAEAADVISPCLNDDDPEVRRMAHVMISLLPKRRRK